MRHKVAKRLDNSRVLRKFNLHIPTIGCALRGLPDPIDAAPAWRYPVTMRQRRNSMFAITLAGIAAAVFVTVIGLTVVLHDAVARHVLARL
jgi:hypothetical protein